MWEISLGKQTLEEFIEVITDKERRRILLLLWGVLFSLVIADGVITEFLIAQDLAWESNPLLVDLIGSRGFLILKILGAGIAILILEDVSNRHCRLALAVTCLGVLIYTAIVYWNIALFCMGL